MIPQPNLSTSLNNYIEHKSPERLVLRKTLDAIAGKLPETAIFGGMVREFALGNARTFSSDIDLVSFASQYDIYQAIKEFSPAKNKYGGYRFVVDKRLYDIWAFEDTWAFREGILKGSCFSDLFNTTFFNLDSALFHLSKKECYVPDFYQGSVANRLLDINLEENPFPEKMADRAIFMAIYKNLFVGHDLAHFLLKNKKPDNNLLSILFIKGLRNHIENNETIKYKFYLKNPFLNNLPVPLKPVPRTAGYSGNPKAYKARSYMSTL